MAANPIVHQAAPDEKVSPVMVYTNTHLFWGDLITKEVIRVGTWLRTSSAPDHVNLYNVKVMMLSGLNQPKPVMVPTAYIPTPSIIAYHLLPPAHEPLDYDPNEASRVQVPVSVYCGPFFIRGKVVISSLSSLAKYIEINHESFASLYDADISHPGYTSMGGVRVPFLLIRQNCSVYSDQSN
jgi:hypothetical protein